MGENNKVYIFGTVTSRPRLSHSFHAEEFLEFELSSDRKSGCEDTLRIIVSERLIDTTYLSIGEKIGVSGQIRSYNEPNGEKTKLVLYVFANDIQFFDGESYDDNKVYLNCFLCKEPVYRRTPNGREISDMLVAVNRSYGKTDYIPCIAWGRNARYVSRLAVGSNLKIEGRFQSREYNKRIDDDSYEKRIAYEVSVSDLEVVGEEK